MGLFGLFGGKKEQVAVEAPPCPHGMLVPHWETVQDMGIESKATRYLCDACHQEFTPEEAARMRGSMTEMLVAQEVTTDEAKAAIDVGALPADESGTEQKDS